MDLFSKIILVIFFISILVSVNRSDFIGIIIPLIIYIIYSTTFKKEVLKNINRFLISIGANIIYDLIWLLMNFEVKFVILII